MDREIPKEMRQKRQRKLILISSAILATLLAVVLLFPKLFEDSLLVSSLQIGVVDRGAIEITVSASGKLSPLVEEIIVSPINSRILEIYKNPGDSVEEGEPLLKLELTSVETEYKQKLDEREMMKSKLVQVDVRLNNAISDLKMQEQIKDMQLKQLYTDLKSELYLDSIGASTLDKVQRARLNYEEAKIELKQLKQKIDNEKRNAEAEINVQKLELSIFDKTLAENARLLKDAHILSSQKATLTYINNQIGSQVALGSQIAIISDLSRFKVEAEVAEGHREKISLGAKAIIDVGKIQLTGTVINISPSIANGLIRFIVVPDDFQHSGLRSGLKAEVYVLHGKQDDVLRLPNGRWFDNRKGEHVMWVINDNVVESRIVKLGESSFEYVEVVSGLTNGDKVILSDMESYKNKKSIKLK